jgi:hypothetical protein
MGKSIARIKMRYIAMLITNTENQNGKSPPWEPMGAFPKSSTERSI